MWPLLPARSLLVPLLALSALALGACAASSPDGEPESPEPVSDKVYALGTVQDAVTNGCSTVSVWGLSQQIVAQVNCLVPDAYEQLPDRPNISKGSAVFPFLQAPAVTSLVAAVDAHPSTTLQITSMLRTVAQQYLLYQWGQTGSCGVSLAATPGNSNHESGLALDVSNYGTWTSALQANDFQWFGSSDAVHFTYVGPGANDLSGKDVLAFQMLWNINNTQDKIAEDGIYGPQTEARLKASPADGFPIPPDCHPNTPPNGVLEEASCDRVAGWAQDPDDPTLAIGVHVYFGGPAGDAAATGIQTVANVQRDDLCATLGSCEHGFLLDSPLSLQDGQPHPVYAYGIDSQGGDNSTLTGSPLALQCSTAIPPGVRRLVHSPAVMTAWHFSAFWDVLPVTDAALSALAQGNALPDAPVLARADDGSPQVWLIDGTWRRHVPDPTVAAAWEFDLGAAQTLPAATLYAMSEGTPVRARPFLIQGSAPSVYLMDDAQTPSDADAGPVGDDAGGAGGSAPIQDSGPSADAAGQGVHPALGNRGETASGCACEASGSGSAGYGWLAFAAVALCGIRRRR